MRKVTTTIAPHETIEVEEAEYQDLKFQGLIAEDKTPKKDLPEGDRN